MSWLSGAKANMIFMNKFLLWYHSMVQLSGKESTDVPSDPPGETDWHFGQPTPILLLKNVFTLMK